MEYSLSNNNVDGQPLVDTPITVKPFGIEACLYIILANTNTYNEYPMQAIIHSMEHDHDLIFCCLARSQQCLT